MNPAFLFTVLLYAPIGAVVIGISVLVVALVQRSVELPRTSYVFFVIAAFIAIPAYLSEHSREMVDVGRAASGTLIDPMKVSLLATEILGGLSLLALILDRLRLPFYAPSAGLIILIGMLTTVSLTYSTNLGSHVR